MKSGALIVVGSGIDTILHLTMGARAWIEAADEVLYALNDLPSEELLRKLNPRAVTLSTLYAEEKPRRVTYKEMVERILSGVRLGRIVCAVFYGHPGVLCDAGGESVRQARLEGFPARMLPGISTDACLLADLGIDPGVSGYQSFYADDFLIHRRRFDTTSPLVLWQVDTIGDGSYRRRGYDARHLPVLLHFLMEHYGPDHEVVLYRAPLFPMCEPEIKRTSLARMSQDDVRTTPTLYVPPKGRASLDLEMLDRLGVPRPLGHARQAAAKAKALVARTPPKKRKGGE
jgi:uncharacterized protein YabN with tetrapyrrole methylase and pyrophosphatase domain